MCGERSFTAVGEWAADAPQWVLAVLGARRHRQHGGLVAPHEATLRRTIQAFDAELLDAVISAWLAARATTTTADETGLPAWVDPATSKLSPTRTAASRNRCASARTACANAARPSLRRSMGRRVLWRTGLAGQRPGHP